MQIGLYWSLLAGFLLGFSVSTLWEWFYFRRRRMVVRDQKIRELEAKLLDQRNRVEEPRDGEGMRDEWPEIGYRSPGVFLETEADEDVGEGTGAANPDAEQEAPVNRMRRSDFDPITRTATAVRAVPFRTQNVPANRDTEDADEHAHSDVTELGDYSLIAPDQDEGPPSVRERENENSESKDARATAPSRPEGDYPDDLSRIKGIGEVYKQRLYAAGIYTWHQIANSSQSALRAATKAYPSSNVDEWPPQAVALAARYNRQEAVYTGPPPDDLTKITGIGPVGTQTLYRAGICTFGELASTTEEWLSELFPIGVAGDEPDFASWIAQARQLQASKSKK